MSQRSVSPPMMEYDVNESNTSDWINPLLRHAMFVEGAVDSDRKFANWTSPGFIQANRADTVAMTEAPFAGRDPAVLSSDGGDISGSQMLLSPVKPPVGKGGASSSSAISSIFPGDVYIRTYMKAGEAFFRVKTIDNDLQMAYQENDVGGISFRDLLNPRKYELLYRGEQIDDSGNDHEGDEASVTSEMSLSPSKYYASEENRAAFHENYHVYSDETNIIAVSKAPEEVTKKQKRRKKKKQRNPETTSPSSIHSPSPISMPLSPPGPFDDDDEEGLPIFHGSDSDAEPPITTKDILHPLPTKLSPSPTKQLQRLAPVPSQEQESRPSTASFSYLQACDKQKVVPWNLVTRVQDEEDSPTLDLHGLSIGKSFSECLSHGLSSSSLGFLEKINLMDNRLKGSDIEPLMKAIKDKNVKGLNLSKNRIGLVGGFSVLEFLKSEEHAEHIQELSLGSCEIGEEGVTMIVNAFLDAKSQVLEVLNLSKNGLSRKFANKAIELLDKSKCLTDLDLSWNELNTEGSTKLVQHLGSSKSPLERLNLSWNGIKGSILNCTKTLTMCLGKCSLSYLDLNHNKFQVEEISVLREAASENMKLTLDLALPEGEETEVMLKGRKETKCRVNVSGTERDMTREEIRDYISQKVQQYAPPPPAEGEKDKKKKGK